MYIYLKNTIVAVLLLLVFQSCSEKSVVDTSSLSKEVLSALDLIPLPSSASISGDAIDISSGFRLDSKYSTSKEVTKVIEAGLQRISKLGYQTNQTDGLPIHISIGNSDLQDHSIKTNESYKLSISTNQIKITAENKVGLSHAFSTLSQLLYQAKQVGKLRSIEIVDTPRYAWRGLMLDVARHWIPKEVVLENIEAMASVKLNVLHLHLSDDQGFRVESKKLPLLHQKGSGGQYYTQEDISEIVSYAGARGIRVVPEFNMPGHVSSWLEGYPKIGTGGAAENIQKSYGVHKGILDPTSDATYTFIKVLLTEMATLFPDEYIHVGGDEVTYENWNNNEEIMAFMKEGNLQNFAQLKGYFTLKVQKIVAGLGKKMMTWDDALRPELNSKDDVVIQSWHGQAKLEHAARLGHKSVLSSGWYLDHKLPIKELYKIDPSESQNQLTYTADSTDFSIYQLDVSINDLPAKGSLMLFGLKSKNISGVINIMGVPSSIENTKLISNNLTFQFSGDAGILKANMTLAEDESVSGTILIGGLPLNITGVKAGGDDMPDGVKIPQEPKKVQLTAEQAKLIIGGEACLWSDWINKNNMTSRIWPRTAAVAEKLWSPKESTQDVADFYRRSFSFSNYLNEIEIDYSGNQIEFIKSISTDVPVNDMASFINVLEEVKYYGRFSSDLDHNIDKPLNNLADIVSPESMTSYKFGTLVDELLENGMSDNLRISLDAQLNEWIPIYRSIEPAFKKEAKIGSVEVLALALSDLAKISGHVMESGTLTEEESVYYTKLKANAQREIDGVLLAPAEHMIRLIDSYRQQL